MGAIKNHLIECHQLLEAGKYKELLLECKEWEDPAAQLWAIVAWYIRFQDAETGYIHYEKGGEWKN